jgi:hypothetical protein
MQCIANAISNSNIRGSREVFVLPPAPNHILVFRASEEVGIRQHVYTSVMSLTLDAVPPTAMRVCR